MGKFLKAFTKTDKLLHILAGLAIMVYSSSIITVFLGRVWGIILGILITLVISLGKELYDYYHPDTHTCDKMDIVADCMGIVLGLIPMLL